MKKLFGIFLILVFVFSIGSTSFAATNGADIPEQPVPGAPIQNAVDDTYGPPEVQIFDPEVPGGAANTTDIKDTVLPKTGGVPAGTFYAGGGVLVAAALILSMKKTAKG